MLALTSLASASVPSVDVDERMRLVRIYVQRRLQAEVKAQPRGYAAQLSRKLDVSTAHMANLLNDKANVGEQVLRKFAAYWGMTFDELERAAIEAPRVIVPVDVDRVLAVAEALVGKGQDASLMLRVRAVTADLAAAKGEILDEEIVSRLLGKPVDEGRPAERLRRKRPTRS